MADLKQLKMKPRDDFGSDDPLAELTRIMGLAPQTAPDDDSFDDFGIDLERELLGDLGGEDRFTPPQPANLSLPADRTQDQAAQPVHDWQAAEPAGADDARWAAAETQPTAPFRVVAPEPSAADHWQDAGETDDADALELELGAYLDESDLFASTPDAAEEPAFETAPTSELESNAVPAAQPARGFVPAAAAPVAHAYDEAPAAQEPEQAEEEDPFDRLAAMSREWQQRRQAREAGLVPEAAAPAQPVFTAVPSVAAASSEAAQPPRLTVTPVADARPAAEGVAPHTPIRFVPVDEIAVTSAPQPVEPSQATVAASQPALRQPQPQPVTAAPAAAAAPDGIFDPFAELAAMAEQSRSRASAYTAPSAAAAPDVAPASQPAPTAGAAPVSAPVTPAATDLTARRDGAAGPVVQPRPRTTPTSFQPSAERSSSWRRVDPVRPSAAPVAAAVAVEAAREEALSVAPAPQEPVAEAPVDTWDAISAWAGQPETRVADEPEPQADETIDYVGADAAMERDETEAYAGDDTAAFHGGADAFHDAAEARHADVEPAAPVGQAHDEGEFDLGSLLEAELAEEANAPSWTSQASPAAARVAQPRDEMRGWQQAAPFAAAPAADAFVEAPSDAAAPAGHAEDDYGPEVDTIEVPLAHYEVAHDLDLPELAFEDETPPPSQADELDLEFANAFEELAVGRAAERPQPAHAAAAPVRGWGQASAPQAQRDERAAGAEVDDLESAFDEAVRSWAQTENNHGAYAPAGYQAGAYAADEQLDGAQWSDDLYEDREAGEAGLASAFYPGGGEAEAAKAPPRRRGLMVAALVASVAVIGGIGAFALSFGDSGSGGAPVLVRADPDPVKVKPEQPGGVTIPNQDKAVYDRGATGEGTQPSQETLVSTREEPIDLAVRTAPLQEAPPADAARVKSEERVDPVDELVAAPADDVPAIAPRRVRTMVVRPDGTLVPREEPAPQAVPETAPLRVAAAPEAVALSPADADATEIRAASQAAVAEAAAEAPAVQEPPAALAETAEPAPAATAEAAPAGPSAAPVRVVESQTITREAAPRQATPDRGPVAPSRPADQPVDIVNRAPAAPTQVAAAAPAPVAAAPSSEWSVQIASQPSPDGAQASYADLSRRYGSILGGRGVNIVKADIAGKGTFWRVRIPAASRAEANSLCETYKAAGGSCFVSR